MERLENEPFFMEEWLEHQRRDEFWKHGSTSEDFAGFPIPALVIAGWARWLSQHADQGDRRLATRPRQ